MKKVPILTISIQGENVDFELVKGLITEAYPESQVKMWAKKTRRSKVIQEPVLV